MKNIIQDEFGRLKNRKEGIHSIIQHGETHQQGTQNLTLGNLHISPF